MKYLSQIGQSVWTNVLMDWFGFKAHSSGYTEHMFPQSLFRYIFLPKKIPGDSPTSVGMPKKIPGGSPTGVGMLKEIPGSSLTGVGMLKKVPGSSPTSVGGRKRSLAARRRASETEKDLFLTKNAFGITNRWHHHPKRPRMQVRQAEIIIFKYRYWTWSVYLTL